MNLSRSALRIRTVTLSAQEYTRDVLPYSHEEWGGGRERDEHARDVTAVAHSRFGRRRRHFIGLAGDEAGVTASLKLYARTLRFGERTLHASGIGAVFTPPHLRGRGYATMLLASLLDEERAAGRDFVFLFSDIGTAFYEALGFTALPSRTLSFGVNALSPARVDIGVLQDEDWKGVAACSGALARRQPFFFTRPPAVWEWLRLRAGWRTGGSTQPVALVARSKERIRAYVIGRRDPAHDCFSLEDFGFTSANVPALHYLLSAAAGDLRRIRGWLPPAGAREALPRGVVGARKRGILLAAGLSAAGRDWVAQAGTARPFDPVWNADQI